jgi:hypothetical protein
MPIIIPFYGWEKGKKNRFSKEKYFTSLFKSGGLPSRETAAYEYE